MAPPKSRTELLKETEDNPIKMGETIIENSRTEKYLGDQIHEDGTAASIHETLNNIIPIAYERGEEILNICNQPSLIGSNIASGPVEQFKSRISSKLIANSKSWIGLNQTHNDRLQKVQDDFLFYKNVPSFE